MISRRVAPPRLSQATARVKPAALLVLSIVIALALLISTVGAALRLGGLAGLGRSGDGGALDYARGPAGGYFPLTDSFVDDALGQSFRTRSAAAPRTPAQGAATADSAAPGTGRARADGDDEAVPPRDDVGAALGNDHFVNAYAVRGLPFSTRAPDEGTREPGEPSSCGGPLGGTRWYRFSPRSDTGLTATTSSDVGTIIAVYTGSALSRLQVIGCGSAPRGEAVVSFAGKTGTTYWLQVTRSPGVGGPVAFALDVRGSTTLVERTADLAAPTVSGNGRYVVYTSQESPESLAEHDCVHLRSLTPPCQQLYIRDLRTAATRLVSSPDGGESGGDHDSHGSAVTPDGRFVAFYSLATNLVPDDNNGTWDAFVRDMASGRVERVSVTTAGEEMGTGTSPQSIGISSDGRYVAFEGGRPAPPGTTPTGCCREVFVHDLATRRTRLVSDGDQGAPVADAYVAGISADGRRVAFGTQGAIYVTAWMNQAVEPATVSDTGAGVTGECPSGHCLSADGRYVVFESAHPAVTGDANDAEDVFVRDLLADRTVRASVTSSGSEAHPTPEQATEQSTASISPDGRFVAFSSNAPDLVADDTNGNSDVFVHDLRRGTTVRVSVLDDGSQSSSGVSVMPSVSDRARTVAFISHSFTPQDGPATYGIYARSRTFV